MAMPGFYIQTAAIALVIGYLIGNFQSAVFLSRRFLKDDIRAHGSGNPGSTNMKRTFGNKWGVITFLLDAGKCVLALLLGRWMGRAWGLIPSDPALGAAMAGWFGGVGAVWGHCWPVFSRFKGGKGSACNFAFMAAACFWPCGAVTALIALAVYFLSHRISLVSLTAALFFTVITAFEHTAAPYLWCFAAANALAIFIRHTDNIKRLLAGTEGTVDY